MPTHSHEKSENLYILQFVTNATLRSVVEEWVLRPGVGSTDSLLDNLAHEGHDVSRRHLVRILNELFDSEPVMEIANVRDHEGNPPHRLLVEPMEDFQRRTGQHLLVVQMVGFQDRPLLLANDRRGSRWWAPISDGGAIEAIERIQAMLPGGLIVVPHGAVLSQLVSVGLRDGLFIADFLFPPLAYQPPKREITVEANAHPHLHELEAESIRIIREAVAVAKKPGMLFSMGKDSMVMWALAAKAFWPEPPPFPLAVIDTQWKFRDMYRFRNYMENRADTDVAVYINPDAIRDNVNPFDFGSGRHTEITKTHALKQVLDNNQFDYVFGGARRDEERSRAKERVFSVRNPKHGWDPKAQRPELWNLYNTLLPKGHSMRVFPLSNWTELDIWRYIESENIPVVPLYFSKVRPFVERDGALIMVDDERFRLEPEEQVKFEPIRFRTLGCYPLTGGVRSSAQTVSEIIAELEESRVSERSSRVIDFDPGASMEQKKKEGYF
jgi:sulfate adenylyltransferase subunit 2